MLIRASRTTGLLALVVWSVTVAGTLSGCGSEKKEGTDGGTHVGDRARQVAAAWDGSKAAGAWRHGYYPMGEAVQLPKGGLRGRADQLAYRNETFVLRGELPATAPRGGRVTWANGRSLTRPLAEADKAYKALARARVDGPHLTVTGAKLGQMTLPTSRGPAKVPAWLFTLEGYAAPLKRAAAIPSKLPTPPVKPARDLPGSPLDQLLQIAADGRTVTVIALHGACDDGPQVDVLETRGSVVLSASVKNPDDGDCTKQAKKRRVTVHLDHPVGDRVLLDAHMGRPLSYGQPQGPSPSWS
ncbi:hypothetical protein [Streptomyces flavofungini]|uniref:Lipoprotein n=1 Tax=Streptomyces flavofungini TaxID=68200 RepID=A0ABS0X0W7_9ACTN|nr:hypothetical protein [Streptomyces flavofungini]GHC60217.1 hypothetical protein GCM10010349_29410 [Streptomyces flavofungini]